MTSALRIGVDLGQSVDHSVFAAVRVNGPKFDVLNVTQFPLATSYVKVRERLVHAIEIFHEHMSGIRRRRPGKEETATVAVYVDAGGARSFIDELAEDLRGLDYVSLTPVHIVTGDNVRETVKVDHRRELNIGKVLLVDRLRSLVQARQVRGSHPGFKIVMDELTHFRVLKSSGGMDTFGAASGKHDDALIALALACWVKPAVEVDDLARLNAELRGNNLLGLGGEMVGGGEFFGDW